MCIFSYCYDNLKHASCQGRLKRYMIYAQSFKEYLSIEKIKSNEYGNFKS